MKEKDIRPKELFDAYLKTVAEDIASFFGDRSGFLAVDCPACGTNDAADAFVKDGFRYVECRACRTLYVSPRPSQETLDRFYRTSKSSRFWVERFYKETEDARREKIFRPRAREVVAAARGHSPKKDLTVVDVGAGYGTFLEELRATGAFREVWGLEPSTALADVCEKKGFPVLRATAEEARTPRRFDVATSFELYEHLFSPHVFLQAVHGLLAPGGLLYLTTLSGQGFDTLLLGPASKAISPPHHINFINPASLARGLERAGFEVLEIKTPGRLDVDIVLNRFKETAVNVDAFTRKILFDSGAEVQARFQTFLQENRLSSHIQAVARRR